MDLSEKQTYRFENIEVQMARGCLLRNGEEIHLRPKALQVLVYLLEKRERLVTKDELMETIWNGTAVTDDVLVQCVKEIRRAVGDKRHHSRFIKTVPKAGYRFIGAVEEDFNRLVEIQTEEITHLEYEFEEEVEPQPLKMLQVSALSLSSNPKPSRALFSIIAVLTLLLACFSVYFAFNFLRSSSPQAAEIVLPQTPDRTNVAVMFFENSSGDAELDWLREGLPDMLIAELSRSGKLSVLSRGQFHLLLERSGLRQNRKIALEEALDLARKVRAQIIVTGSFARLGDKIRIDVSVLDGKNGLIQTAESLTVDKPEQILTEIDLLSLRLLAKLDPGRERESAGKFSEVMTDNLEAFRFYSLGVEKAQALHTNEAIALLEKAVALDPEFAMAHARIGYAYAVTSGRLEEGKPYLEKAFRLSSRLTEKDRLNISAWYAIANLDFPVAIKSYRQIINRFPFETEAYHRLARLLTGEEKFDEAVSVLRQGLALDPESKELYNALGGILSRQGKHDEAIAVHRRYVALAPSEANAYDSLGLSFQWAGNYEEAINSFRRALELKPDFDIATVHLANVKFQLGQYREAIELFRRYIDVAPSVNERARGFNSISIVHLKKNDLAAAEPAVQEAVKNNPDLFSEMIFIALRRGEIEKARQLCENFFAQNKYADRGARVPRRYEFFTRGSVALREKRAEQAIEYFREALRLPPTPWNLIDHEDCLANALLELGRFDEAIAEYERILRLNPNYPLAQFHLARAYEQKGFLNEARDSYNKFLRIWKNADQDIPEVLAARKFVENF